MGITASNLVIVLPVFNDVPCLVQLLKQLADIFRAGEARLSLVIVDDGSLPPISESIAQINGVFAGCLLTVKRNVGHQRAIAIGIAYAVENVIADTMIVMDADGEDRPSDVLRLLAAIENRGSSIVVAARAKRSENLVFRILYQLYRLIFFSLTGYRINFGNFLVLPPVAARRLANMGELWLSLPATILRSRVPIIYVPTERGDRFHGESQMNFVSLVIHGLRALAVFVESALTRIILGALALLLLCGVASAIAIIQKFLGVATPGWLTTVVGVSVVILLSSIILCFVSLAISIAGGAQAIAPPLETYRALIANITELAATPLSGRFQRPPAP